MTTPPSDPLRRLAHLVDSIDVAMFTTIGPDGALESRPMATQAPDPDGALWFFTARDSHLRDRVESGSPVNIAYSHPDKQSYISVTGSATVVDDATRRHGLWQPTFAKWFPGGRDDPALILVRVQIEHADYWESPAYLPVRLDVVAKAASTGRQGTPDRHGHLDI